MNYFQWANNCRVLNDDGQMFEVNEKYMPNEIRWSDMADKDISMKMEF